MKKIFVVLFTFISLAANAQQFRYGGFIAPQISFWSVEGDLYANNGNGFGYQIGVMADQTIGSKERFAISTGLTWNAAPGGFVSASLQNNTGKEWHWKVNTLDIPISIRLRSDQLKKTVLYAQYGVNIGITMSTSIKNEKGNDGSQGFEYEKINPSLAMGFGIENQINDKMTLLIGTYFINGVKNMIIDDANDDNMFPQQVGLKCGILF
ncbi:MAG: outer membrane beta-barrel protein [Chitinophagales bacterium]|nr:outer membrane beta-barrel protein [Chitinophagales bacterium]